MTSNRRMGRAGNRCVLAVTVLLGCAATLQARPPRSRLAPNQLVRQVVAHELQAEAQDHSHWMFRLEQFEPSTGARLYEVVQTPQGWVRRQIAINGRPLTPEEQKKEDERLKKLLSDPDEQRKNLEAIRNDVRQAQELMKMLPDAFIYTYAGRQGQIVKLNFRPNPQFHPSSREATVFHDMVGSLWVDTRQLRLLEIRGKLTKEVKFGGGILGHLDKGGTFDVKQSQIAPGYWDVTYMDIEMNGKALFFKTISVHEKDIRSDYHRVPDTLTLAQAVDLLKKQTSVLAGKR